VERRVLIVLDTHAWIWWAAEPGKLSAKARAAIEASDTLGVCAVSCWEVAMLVAKGRLELDREVLVWLRQALALERLELCALTPQIAVGASRLPETFPGDPADRMIAATAASRRAGLVSKDARLRNLPDVRTIW
jgi:PIN domain nuclease of toxin-antitoxin system